MSSINQQTNPSFRFLISFALLFCLFYGFNLGYIGLSTPGGLYSPFLDQYVNYIKAWRQLCIFSTRQVLELMGHTVYTTDTTLKVQDHSGFRLVYSCLGYGVMSFFAAFTLAYPKPLRSRITFLVIGLISIQLLNTLRFVLIALFYQPKPIGYFADHHDVFNCALYLILLSMIYGWLAIKRQDQHPI
jgi:exosortase/archaeosortase family protein